MTGPGLYPSTTIQQYAALRQRARNSWAFHMLIAMVPFCLFVFKKLPNWGLLTCFGAFAIIGVHGVYRQYQIDRCPACAARQFARHLNGTRQSEVGDLNFCLECGVRLLPYGGKL